MSKTSIQWTDFSVNPIRAELAVKTLDGYGIDYVARGHYCEKVSPGCKNCYASRLQPRFRMPQFQEQRTAGVVPYLDPKALISVLKRRKPTKFFWCDMSDMFGEWVPNEWIAACFGVMAATPQHTHQVLTKRSRRMRGWFEWIRNDRGFDHSQAGNLHVALCDAMRGLDWDPSDRLCEELLDNANSWPLSNVWLGVSAEDQQRADERIPDLLNTPAAIRFVSAEPLLSEMDLGRYLMTFAGGDLVDFGEIASTQASQPNRLDWVIVGGESGQNARGCDVEWIRKIVQQCRVAGVSCFVKQLGARPLAIWDEWPWGTAQTRDDGSAILSDGKGGEPEEWSSDLRVREFPRAALAFALPGEVS